MSEILQKTALALADSPLTTKAVFLTGAGSWAGRAYEFLPDAISLVGAVFALFAAAALFIRHRNTGKLAAERRIGVKMQNAHDAKMQVLELERMQIELRKLRAAE